jgi:hypothetical protein
MVPLRLINSVVGPYAFSAMATVLPLKLRCEWLSAEPAIMDNRKPGTSNPQATEGSPNAEICRLVTVEAKVPFYVPSRLPAQNEIDYFLFVAFIPLFHHAPVSTGAPPERHCLR